jgi:AcrR family transcriptional regulator
MGFSRAETRDRLAAAGLELYRERGNFDITAAEIAERAGMTERTFFRYFPDKRDMLFAGGTAMEDLATQAIRSAEVGSALELAVIGLKAVVPLFEERPELVRERQRIIIANDDLLERELSKRSRFCRAISDALAETGIERPTAELTGALAGVVFHEAFTRWLQTPDGGLESSIVASAAAMSRIAAGS